MIYLRFLIVGLACLASVNVTSFGQYDVRANAIRPAWLAQQTFGQENPQPTPEEIERQREIERQAAEAAAAGTACCGGILGSMVATMVAIVLFIGLNIALLVWVARDAKSRGMDSAVLWMLLVMVTSVIGLIIYLCSRPQGQLVQCPQCKNQRLAASSICPHCGNNQPVLPGGARPV